MVFQKLEPAKILSISFIIVYAYFGTLKFFPELSPAEILAQETISRLNFKLIPNYMAIKILALWEVAIAICFVFRPKWAIRLAISHLILTFSPLVLLHHLCFKSFLIPTLEGQYIIKNLIPMSSLIFLWKSTK